MELIIEPQVLFLDEPTSGLDAYTAVSVVKLLKQYVPSIYMLLYKEIIILNHLSVCYLLLSDFVLPAGSQGQQTVSSLCQSTSHAIPSSSSLTP